MATTTPNLGLLKPVVGASADEWGGDLNASLDTLDAKVLDKTTGGTVSGAVNVIAATTAPAVRITQTGTGEALRVEDEANPDASPFVIDAAGNVGVGTSAPAFKMDVAVSGVTSDVAIRSVADSVSNVASLRFFCQNTTEGARISAIRTAATAAPNDLAFYTAVGGVAQEKMRLDSAGNLGLGVTPSAWGSSWKALDFNNRGGLASGFDETDLNNNVYRNNAGGYLYKQTGAATTYNQSTGTHVWLTAPSGTAGATISFTQAMTLTSGGNLLLGTTSDSGFRFSTVVQGTGRQNTLLLQRSDGSLNPNIQFSHDDSGTIINASSTAGGSASQLRFECGGTERARITSAGYFKASNTGTYGGVGGIPDATNTLYHLVQNNQNTTTFAAFNGNTLSNVLNYDSVLASGATGRHYSGLLNAATVYEVIANGNVRNVNNSYGAFSDIKLKQNISDATPKLASLNQLRVVNYNLIGSELKQIGLIAQEVEQVFPGLVESTPDLDPETKEPTGTVTKSVKYSVLVPMLLKAVQELSAKVAALEAK